MIINKNTNEKNKILNLIKKWAISIFQNFPKLSRNLGILILQSSWSQTLDHLFSCRAFPTDTKEHLVMLQMHKIYPHTALHLSTFIRIDWFSQLFTIPPYPWRIFPLFVRRSINNILLSTEPHLWSRTWNSLVRNHPHSRIYSRRWIRSSCCRCLRGTHCGNSIQSLLDELLHLLLLRHYWWASRYDKIRVLLTIIYSKVFTLCTFGNQWE